MPGQVFRLTDMLVEEVSFVDRAANKHVFLLRKKDDTPMAAGPPIQTNPDGTHTAANAAPASANAAPAAAQVTPRTKAGAALTADAKATLTAVMAAVDSQLSDARALIEGATEVATEDEQNVEAILDAGLGAAAMLEDAGSALLGMDEESGAPVEMADDAEVDPDAMPGSDPDEMAKSSLPVGKRFAALVAKRTIVSVRAEKAAHTLVQKIGARMSRKRREALSMAYKTIGAILKDTADMPKPAPPAKPATKTQKNDPAVHVDGKALADTIARLEKQNTDLVREMTTLKAAAAPPAAAPPASNALPASGAAGAGGSEKPERWVF